MIQQSIPTFTTSNKNLIRPFAPKFAVGQRVHVGSYHGTVTRFNAPSGIMIYGVVLDGKTITNGYFERELTPCDCPPEKPKSIPAMMPVAAVMPIHTTFKPIFQLGDVVRTPRGYTSKVVGYGKRSSYELENGNFYGADELTLDIHGAVCDICGDWQPDVITDDGIEICNDCRKRSRQNNRQQPSNIGELNRPPQVPDAYRIEVVMTPRQAQLVSVAVEVHAVPQIAGLLPAPKAADPVQPSYTPDYDGWHSLMEATYDYLQPTVCLVREPGRGYFLSFNSHAERIAEHAIGIRVAKFTDTDGDTFERVCLNTSYVMNVWHEGKRRPPSTIHEVIQALTDNGIRVVIWEADTNTVADYPATFSSVRNSIAGMESFTARAKRWESERQAALANIRATAGV